MTTFWLPMLDDEFLVGQTKPYPILLFSTKDAALAAAVAKWAGAEEDVNLIPVEIIDGPGGGSDEAQ